MANLYFKDYTPVVHFKRAKPTHQECLNYLALFLKNFAFIEESDLQNLGKYFEYFSAKKMILYLRKVNTANILYLFVKVL